MAYQGLSGSDMDQGVQSWCTSISTNQAQFDRDPSTSEVPKHIFIAAFSTYACQEFQGMFTVTMGPPILKALIV
jgi:hypothetical protein